MGYMAEQVSSVKSYVSANSDFNGLNKPLNSYFVVPKDVADSFQKSAEAPVETKDIKKKNKIIKIAGASLAGLFLIIGTIRIMPKSVIKQFDKFKEYIVKKSDEVATSSKMSIFYRKLLSSMRNVSEKARGFNNFVSFKDIWFQRRITDKIPFLKKICDKTTQIFDNIGQKVVKNYYKTASKKFNKLNTFYTNIENEILKDGSTIVEINGIKKTKAEWVKELAQKRKELADIIENNYSTKNIASRNKKMKNIMGNLGDKVWAASFGTPKSFKNKNTYFTFWADKFLANDKAQLTNEMNKTRSLVSLTAKDKAKLCDEIICNNKRFIHPQDISSEKIIREINKLLSEYKSAGKKDLELLNSISEQILNKLDQYETVINHGKSTFKYDESVINAIKTQNTEIRNILMSNKHGKIDEINQIYKALLSKKDYRQLKQVSQNTITSLDNAIRKETVDYFDKLRDWELGAAPTDVVGIASGFATMGGALTLTSDREKRKSILLKAGIPAVGGMAVIMIMTARLTSGGKGLAAGLISSLLLNKIGAYTDDKRKQFTQQLSA